MRSLEDRQKLATCPKCGDTTCTRVFLTAPRVNWFPGSYTYDDRADKLDKMAKEAQAEGFRSQQEIEVALEQARDRAKKLGVEPERLMGGTKANFEGEIKVTPEEKAKHKNLYQNYVEAAMLKQDKKQITETRRALKQFEKGQREKYKNARKYKPTKTREQMAKEAKQQAKQYQNQV